MSDQVGVVIVGCGYWGVNYVRVFNQLTQTRVAAICDQNADRLKEIEKQFPGIATTTRLDDALAMDGVEAAVICTQANSHYDVARQCIDAGKHVLVEKPITTTATDAEDLTDRAKAKGVTLMVGHTFMYNAGVRKVKEYIDNHELGRMYYLYAQRTNLGPIRHDVNALWDLAPHDISIFNYFVGAVPEWVSAVGARVLGNGRDDVGFVTMQYPGGVVGHIHVSWADPHKVREVVVVGSNQRIVFNDVSVPEQVRVFEKGVSAAESEPSGYGEYHFEIRDGAIISPRIEVSEPLRNQATHFISCLQTGEQPLTGGKEGRDVVAVLEAIDRSLELHGAPVSIPSYKETRRYVNGNSREMIHSR